MWRHRGVFYQVDPRLFRDLDGDGVGDLRGLRDGLEYLRWLGVQAVWISPLQPLPAAEVQSAGANWAATGIGLESPAGLARLVETAHRLGLRMLVDVSAARRVPVPPSHRAGRALVAAGARAEAGSAVEVAAERAYRFWFDRGVDAVRAGDRWVENARQVAGPATVPVASVRGLARLTPAALLDVQGAEPGAWEGCPICRTHSLCAHRPVVAPAPWRPRRLMATVHERLQKAADPNAVQWTLGSQRQPRAAGLIGSEQIRAAAVLLLTLPGTPVVTSGDEIGLVDRTALACLRRRYAHLERTPMVWDDTNAHGFAGWPWRPAGNFPAVDPVWTQRRDPDSTLALYRRLIALRHNERALQVGALAPLLANDRLLVYLREAPGNRVLVAMNLGTEPAVFPLRPELRGHYALCTQRRRESQRVGPALELDPGEATVLRITGS